MQDTIRAMSTRITKEEDTLKAEEDGSGTARDSDMIKRTKREVIADLDDTLQCMLKYEAEATACRTDAKVFLKELERRG